MLGSWGSWNGGTNMRAPFGPIWCMSWVTCGFSSRWMSRASRVSFCVNMNQSRLSSCPV